MNNAVVLLALAVERPRLILGAGFVLVGSLLLAATVAYVGLDLYGRSQIDDLTVPQSATQFSLDDLRQNLTVGNADEQSTSSESAGSTGEVPPSSDGPSSEAPPAVTGPTDDTGVGEAAPSEVETNQPADGALWAPRPAEGWDTRQLRTEASGAATGSIIGARFDPVDWSVAPYTIGGEPPASRIIIPAIGLDSSVVELRIQSLGTKQKWETADRAVGHHLGTPNPGERGNAVFSGHINSPFRGEGSIFARLPEIATLLREGRTVDIVIETEERRYLYRVTSTDVREPEEVNVFRPTKIPSLSLVTCWPRTSYNYRFVVDAILVGQAAL